MVDSVLAYLWQAFSTALLQILVLFGPGLLFTLILHFETIFIQNRAIGLMGRGWYLGLFGWLGTIIHELGHAIFCVIFRHKITDLKLFDPDPEDGTLGYVQHSYNRSNIYQLAGNFFIGIGPILLGTAIIYLLSYWLLGLNAFNPESNLSSASFPLNSWDTFRGFLQSLGYSSGHLFSEIFSWQHFSSWQLYVFIYLAFAIGSAITLSPPDIKSALRGFIIIVILIFILNLATIWAGNYISHFIGEILGYSTLFYAVIALIILINVIASLLIILPSSLLNRNRSQAT